MVDDDPDSCLFYCNEDPNDEELVVRNKDSLYQASFVYLHWLYKIYMTFLSAAPDSIMQCFVQRRGGKRIVAAG